MPIQLKNIPLTLLTFCLITIFCALGSWQFSRANEKKALIALYHARLSSAPQMTPALAQIKDPRFFPFILQGHYDTEHSFLLDNKIQNGKIGYEWYTPFHVDHSTFTFLVDRGFVPILIDRNHLPELKTSSEAVRLIGFFNSPPRFFSLNQQLEDKPSTTWPKRIEYLNIPLIEQSLNDTIYPFPFTLSSNQTNEADQISSMIPISPERHLAYSLQWFALALTLLIIFVALNKQP